jgi:uncharacterized protein YggE
MAALMRAQNIIRDAETQQVLGIGGAGSATIVTELATVQVRVSEGVHSGAVTVTHRRERERERLRKRLREQYVTRRIPYTA